MAAIVAVEEEEVAGAGLWILANGHKENHHRRPQRWREKKQIAT
jgi:hypothetical protein